MKNIYSTKIGVDLLIYLYKHIHEEAYSQEISFKFKVTYSHFVKVVQLLEKVGIVFRKAKGRGKTIHLTDKGKKIAKKLNEIDEILTLSSGRKNDKENKI